jgi:hypothetical protein
LRGVRAREKTEVSKVSVEEARKLWGAAETFEDLCQLMVGFIAGEIPLSPGWCGATVDEETGPLVAYLLAFNRAGFLTIVSQPGEPFRPGYDGRCWGQRAFVCGFAQEPAALQIEALTLRSDLHITVYPPGEEGGYRTPAVSRGMRPCLWVGDAGFCQLEHFEEYCNERAMRALREAWSVNVVDLRWGRREHLWSILAQELCSP